MLPAQRRLWGPCEPPSSTAAPGAVGGFMFERVAAQRIARVRIRRPAWRATQGSRPTGRPANGVPFSLVTFLLGKQKKVTALPGRYRPQNTPRTARLFTKNYTNPNKPTHHPLQDCQRDMREKNAPPSGP